MGKDSTKTSVVVFAWWGVFFASLCWVVGVWYPLGHHLWREWPLHLKWAGGVLLPLQRSILKCWPLQLPSRCSFPTLSSTLRAGRTVLISTALPFFQSSKLDRIREGNSQAPKLSRRLFYSIHVKKWGPNRNNWQATCREEESCGKHGHSCSPCRLDGKCRESLAFWNTSQSRIFKDYNHIVNAD